MSLQIEKIGQICRDKIDSMHGEWILPISGYESSFCDILGWECTVGRYADAKMGETSIEMKKGQNHMWFDLVRYAEIQLKIGLQKTVTIFFRYDKKKQYVREIYIIDTNDLIRFLALMPEISRSCIQMKGNVPRQLNIQASASNLDMRRIATLVIKSNREKLISEKSDGAQPPKKRKRARGPKKRKRAKE